MLQAAEPTTHFTSHPRHYPGKIKPWELSSPKARLHRTTRAQPSAAPTISILLLNALKELITHQAGTTPGVISAAIPAPSGRGERLKTQLQWVIQSFGGLLIYDLQQITSYKQLSDKVLAFYTGSQETWDFLDEMFLKQRDTPPQKHPNKRKNNPLKKPN